MAELLIVGGESAAADGQARSLERSGHTVRRATDGASALHAYHSRRPDLTLLDVRLADMTGLEVLANLADDEPVVVLIAGPDDFALAAPALREGMADVLAGPVDDAYLALVIERALGRLRGRRLAYRRTARRESAGLIPIGSSPRMRELAAQVDMLAASDRTTVLLTGETGTGKGSVAGLIHARSSRSRGPFLELACAAYDAESLERELLGVEGRARAIDHPSLLELASGGTLVLDEVGELSASIQSKLLRVLEGKPFRRADGTRDIVADVRLVAATSRDLVAEVNAGRFREELYYRLSVMPLSLPPLRARARDDVVELIARLTSVLASHLPAAPREPSEPALDCLLRYAWPGNIRELRNVLERAMIVGRGTPRIEVWLLPPEVRSEPMGWEGERPTTQTIADVERAHIERTLRAHAGNRTHAARELGISRATLIKKIRDFALQPTS